MLNSLEPVIRAIERATDPSQMSRAAYGEFLEELLSILEGYYEAYREEEDAD